MTNDLVVGFTQSEKERIEKHLLRLIPHLIKDEFILVGGIIIRYYLTKKNIDYPPRPFNDLDILIKYETSIKKSITKDFLIAHYHPKEGRAPYMALIDPITKVKDDFFDYEFAPNKINKIRFDKYLLNIQSVEDQLIKTVFDTQRISEKSKVDPNQFSDTKLLMQISNISLASQYWDKKCRLKYNFSLKDAINRAELITRDHPEWLREHPFDQPKPYTCKECKDNKNFPITPMKEIYKILGKDKI